MCSMPFEIVRQISAPSRVLATESNGISLAKDVYVCAIAIALFMTLMSNDLMFRIE